MIGGGAQFQPELVKVAACQANGTLAAASNPDTETSTPETGSIWAGARFLWRNRTLLTLTAVGAVTFLATEIVAVADLPLIRHFGGNETAAAVLGVLALGIFAAAVGKPLVCPRSAVQPAVRR
jgi:hypothetical protein